MPEDEDDDERRREQRNADDVDDVEQDTELGECDVFVFIQDGGGGRSIRTSSQKAANAPRLI